MTPRSDDPTSDATANKRRLGCLVAAVLAIGLVIGAGTLIGRCDDAKKTPCERYAATVVRELDNCHSGVTREHRHHIEICERLVNATEACLAKIETLSCPQLEADPAAAAGAVCQK